MPELKPLLAPEQFAEKMRQIFHTEGYDPELAHEQADKLLLETLDALGYRSGCITFELATKWYA